MMKSKTVLLAALLYCAHVTNSVAAGCNDFRRDIQGLQNESRQYDINRAKQSYDELRNIADLVKQQCIEQIVSIDTTQAGINSTLAKMLVRLATQYCDKAAGKIQGQVNQANNEMNSKIYDVRNGIPQEARDVAGGVVTGNTAPMENPSWWDRMRKKVQ